MDLTKLLKGKSVKLMTDVRVEVELEIESVEEHKHSRDLEPSTSSNDWWPATEDWSTFDVKFTNGYVKSYNTLSEIKLIEDE
tara:strand:+ start:379 stop:624 length:246 start_codon:yes stop_codon:yes gene_type:complete